MSIIGLISGFFVTKMISANKIMRAQTTKNNMETISMALASFVANNNRLPRPSFDDTGCELKQQGTELSNFVGKVPFYTIGIPVRTTLDGNGKPLIYIVEPQLADQANSIYCGMFNDCFCSTVSNFVSIDQLPSQNGNPVAFVIDTDDNHPNISDKIYVTVSKNTCWISRDMLLMRYLKGGPCRTISQSSNNI